MSTVFSCYPRQPGVSRARRSKRSSTVSQNEGTSAVMYSTGKNTGPPDCPGWLYGVFVHGRRGDKNIVPQDCGSFGEELRIPSRRDYGNLIRCRTAQQKSVRSRTSLFFGAPVASLSLEQKIEIENSSASQAQDYLLILPWLFSHSLPIRSALPASPDMRRHKKRYVGETTDGNDERRKGKKKNHLKPTANSPRRACGGRFIYPAFLARRASSHGYARV